MKRQKVRSGKETDLGICFVEMDVYAASPRLDSLKLRGLVEPAWTLTKGALNASRQLQTIYRHRKHMLAHGLTGLICSYRSRTI